MQKMWLMISLRRAKSLLKNRASTLKVGEPLSVVVQLAWFQCLLQVEG